MLSESSGTSMYWPLVFSDGPLQKSFTRRFDPSVPPITATIAADRELTGSGVVSVVAAWADSETSAFKTAYLVNDFFQLLSVLPSEGIEELTEALREIREFWCSRPNVLPAAGRQVVGHGVGEQISVRDASELSIEI